MKEILQFKKQRDLGSMITDTFAFIRKNYKQLFSIVLKTAGPALIIVVIAYIYYNKSVSSSMLGNTYFSEGLFVGNFFLALAILLISGMVYNSLFYGTIIYYVKSYIENDGNVNSKEVISNVRKDFMKLLGLSFLVTLMVGFGFLLCGIPGIYFIVVLSPVYCVLIFEKRGATDSISHCFDLIKGNWWITFATLFVMGIIYYIVLLIFQIPQIIYYFIKAFTVFQEASLDPSQMFDWVYVALSSFSVIAQNLLISVIVICTVFIYFDLNEKKNSTGAIETIESLGKRD